MVCSLTFSIRLFPRASLWQKAIWKWEWEIQFTGPSLAPQCQGARSGLGAEAVSGWTANQWGFCSLFLGSSIPSSWCSFGLFRTSQKVLPSTSCSKSASLSLFSSH
jgi:hypothetical protein